MMTSKIAVCIPLVEREIPIKLQKFIDTTKFEVITTKNLGQELARTTLVTEALNKGYESIAFIDSDMSPNIDLDAMLEKFWHLNLPVISALTSSRGKGHKLLLFKKNPDISYPLLDETLFEENTIVPVYAIGFGACLIRREVFEKVDLPWFKCGWEYEVPETLEVKYVGGTNMGADFYFSLKCQQNNIPLYIDCGSIVHHMELHKESSYKGDEFPWIETIQKVSGAKNG